MYKMSNPICWVWHVQSGLCGRCDAARWKTGRREEVAVELLW